MRTAIRSSCAAAAFWVSLQAANAVSGGELLQLNDRFAHGYVFGLVESQIVIQQSYDTWEATRQCMVDSGMNSKGWYDLVETYLRRNPKRLAEPAVAGVLNAINEMCNPAHKPD